MERSALILGGAVFSGLRDAGPAFLAEQLVDFGQIGLPDGDVDVGVTAGPAPRMEVDGTAAEQPIGDSLPFEEIMQSADGRELLVCVQRGRQ